MKNSSEKDRLKKKLGEVEFNQDHLKKEYDELLLKYKKEKLEN